MRRNYLVLMVLAWSSLSAQTERVRIMSYNLLYYRSSSSPCTHTFTPSQRDAQFKEIIKYSNPDLLVVNEMGANAANPTFIRDFVLNTDGVTKYAHAAFNNNSFSSIANMLFYDGNKFELHTQTAVTKDLNGNDLVRIIDLYTLYYKEPKLSLGADTVFFTVAAAHLKAGSSSSDKTERGQAAEALMSYLSQSHSIENVILAGDLNLYTSSEAAYQYFLNYSVAAERFEDPINMPGSWSNNASFASIHTQSTHSSSSGCHVAGGMDDRFDFLLLSDEIMDGDEGMSYVPNSYTAIGQDGNHFNSSVNAGPNSAVPSSIADALYDFSDHLPVSLEMDIQLSNISLAEKQRVQRLWVNNPADESLQIQYRHWPEGELQVQFYDLRGRVLIHRLTPSHQNELSINIDQLPAGVYLLRVGHPNGTSITEKIVVK